MSLVRWPCRERFFAYDAEEFKRWVAGDAQLLDALLKDTGETTLGKSRQSYGNQAKAGKGSQHYPEVRYALHLIRDQGFDPAQVIYENYYLSAEVIRRAEGLVRPERDAGLRVQNTRQLRRVFSDAFFEAFDDLCRKNPRVVAGKSLDMMVVDLFAIHLERHICGFYEIKKYNPDGNRTERVQPQQLAVLAFVQHIVEKLGTRAFVGEPYTVNCELIVFVTIEAQRTLKFAEQTHAVEFST
jgi:hypothetical protein